MLFRSFSTGLFGPVTPGLVIKEMRESSLAQKSPSPHDQGKEVRGRGGGERRKGRKRKRQWEGREREEQRRHGPEQAFLVFVVTTEQEGVSHSNCHAWRK